MISSRYGLKRNPFRGAPDPECFFPSDQHRNAVDLISTAITERAGLVLVMGDIGLGKTTVCRTVQERHRGEFVMGYLGNPFLTAQEFGEQILHEFGQERGSAESAGEVVRALRGFLERHFRERRPVVLFIDEARLLGPDVLEFLLILTNVQDRGEHLLQVVLSGQAEFQETLRQPRFSSLNQRLGNRISLRPLTRRETARYVEHRMRLAGAQKHPFSVPALHIIWKMSGGTPRLINQMCDHLLRQGGGPRDGRIGTKEVRRLAADPVFAPLLFPAGRPARGRLALAAAVLLGLVIVASGVEHAEKGRVAATAADRDVETSRPIASSVEAAFKETGVRPPEIVIPAPPPEPSPPPAVDSRVETALTRIDERLSKLTRSVQGLQETIPDDQFAFDPAIDAPPAQIVSEPEPVPKPVQPEPRRADIRVGAIFWNDRPEARMAVLDDHIVHEGDAVAGYRVVAINENSVELEKGGRTFVTGLVRK